MKLEEMMKSTPSILNTVGHTPLVRLVHVTKGIQPALWAKLDILTPPGV